MRLVACAFSALLLSGCSWLGIGGSKSQHGVYGGYNNAQSQAQYGQRGGQRRAGPCQINTPTQPIPQGCRPEQVTLAVGGAQGYGQNAQGQYASAGYGSHADVAQRVGQHQKPQRRQKRPWLRGQFGLEIDGVASGELFAPGTEGGAAVYDRLLFREGSVTGSVSSGQTVTTVVSSIPERIIAPTISFDDVYSAPLRVSAGLEAILSNHVTVFANAGYTRAEGKIGGGVEIIDELRQTVTTTDFDPLGVPLGSVTNVNFIPNEVVARFNYDFNELERLDFEAGGRYYFNPVFKQHIQRPLTPFVSASGGLAYYNETTVRENQQQRFLGRAFNGTQVNPDGDFFDVAFGDPVQIYDSQWVGYGAVKAGLEWQVTPKTALAFEAGVKFEQARDFSNGAQGDDIISIPLTIRGSYNF